MAMTMAAMATAATWRCVVVAVRAALMRVVGIIDLPVRVAECRECQNKHQHCRRDRNNHHTRDRKSGRCLRSVTGATAAVPEAFDRIIVAIVVIIPPAVPLVLVAVVMAPLWTWTPGLVAG